MCNTMIQVVISGVYSRESTKVMKDKLLVHVKRTCYSAGQERKKDTVGGVPRINRRIVPHGQVDGLYSQS